MASHNRLNIIDKMPTETYKLLIRINQLLIRTNKFLIKTNKLLIRTKSPKKINKLLGKTYKKAFL